MSIAFRKKKSQVVHMGGVWFPDVPVSRSQQPSTGQVESMRERFDVVVHFCPAKLWVEVVWFPARVYVT